jgi:ribosome-associated protein
MENFKLKEGEEYIELKNLIKILGWVDTGGEAKIRIDNQEIKVNGEIETQRRKKIRRGDLVVCGSKSGPGVVRNC